MRALLISAAVAGAVALTGCQTTGNNLGGMEYDKTALGTVMVLLQVMAYLKVTQTQVHKTTVRQPLVL